jgi:hypothetical protein
VLVHVGFALSKIDEDEALHVFEFLDRMKQLDELDVASPADVTTEHLPAEPREAGAAP